MFRSRAGVGATLGRLATAPLGLGTAILISHVLSVPQRGAFVLGQLAAAITAAAVSGIPTVIAGRVRREPTRLNNWLVTGRRVSVFASSVGSMFALAILVPLAGGTTRPVLLLALAPLFTVFIQNVAGELLITDRLGTWGALQTVVALAQLCGIGAGALVTGGGLSGAVIGSLAGSLATAALAANLRARLPCHEANRGRPVLVSAALLGVLNLVSLANYRIDTGVLQATKGLASVGTYSVAVAVAELPWLLTSVIASALTGRLVADDEASALTSARAGRMAVLLAVASALTIACSAPLLPLAFGRGYRASELPLLILLPGVVCFAPAGALAQLLTIGVNRPRSTLAAAAGAALTTGVLAPLVIPSWGTAGAALASSAGYLVGTTLGINRAIHHTDLRARDLIPRKADVTAVVGLHRTQRVPAMHHSE